MSAVFQETEFQDAGHIPEQRPDLSSLTHYGCSPAFDLNLSDRDVGHKFIKAQALVAFRSLPYFVAIVKDDDAPPPTIDGLQEAPPKYTAHVKSARACLDEVHNAYAVNNQWGYTPLNALIGLEGRIALKIFHTVLPERMTLPRMAEHLATEAVVEIQTVGFPEGVLNPYTGETAEECAESVRRALLQGCREVMTFCRESLDAAAQEMAERRAGGLGKPKADKNDERMAAAMNEPVPTPTTVQAPPPKDDLARAIAQQTEVMRAFTLPQPASTVDPRVAELEAKIAAMEARFEKQYTAPKGK